MTRLTITREMFEEASEAARLRQANAVELGLQPANGLVTESAEEDFKISLQGTCGERIVWEFFKHLKWHKFTPGYVDGQCPDIGDSIDAKTIKQTDHRLMIAHDDNRWHVKPEWQYVLVQAAGWPTFEIIGWISGAEVLEKGKLIKPRPRRPAYVVEPDKLRPFSELRAMFPEPGGPPIYCCEVCGEYACHGIGVNPREGTGHYFCKAHVPSVKEQRRRGWVFSPHNPRESARPQ